MIVIVGIIVDVRGWLCTGFEKFSTWKWAGRQFICSPSRKSINSRFTDHLDGCIALTRFRPRISTLQGKTTSISANQRRTQPSAATRSRGNSNQDQLWWFNPRRPLLNCAHPLSPTTVGFGIAHILAIVAEGRESSSDRECRFRDSVNVLCEACIFPRAIPIDTLLLSRDMIKCDNSTRLWWGFGSLSSSTTSNSSTLNVQ